MHVTGFTPLSSLVGGLLVGLAAATLWIVGRRVAGISGILAGLGARDGERGWRAAFVGGLLAGGALVHLVHPAAIALPSANSGTLVAAGLLVGVGTRLAGGCTSGHGLCGTSRLAPRSLVATAVFMLFGMAVVFVVRHVGAAR